MSDVYVPDSLHAAGDHVRLALHRSLERLEKPDFVRAWCSLVYLFPGLHPDEYRAPDNEWPPTIKKFAAEAWRRFEAGELADDELYCYIPATTRIQRECAELERQKPWLFRDNFAA